MWASLALVFESLGAPHSYEMIGGPVEAPRSHGMVGSHEKALQAHEKGETKRLRCQRTLHRRGRDGITANLAHAFDSSVKVPHLCSELPWHATILRVDTGLVEKFVSETTC